jgi:tetratricopeptide (TPR) repeat protein
LVVIGLLLSSSSPVLADTWYEHYAAADDALDEGQWREAVDHLNRALEKKGDSGVRVRTYGMKFTAYFPYLKLGIAYYELGEIDAALQAFETEERLGAIVGSEDNARDLGRYQGLARQAREAARQAEADRIAGIVEESLTRARDLESKGRLEDAIGALGNALAVAPDDTEAQAMLAGLRSAVVRRQDEATRGARAGSLLEQGRIHLDAGELSEAASALSQSLSLVDSEEARELLARAQQRLREELENQEIARQEDRVATILSEVVSLESSGQLVQALDRLQSVLALEPANQEALELEGRLLNARRLADRQLLQRQTIDELLGAAGVALESKDVSVAMASANQVLGIDPGNERALEYLAEAYRVLNARLLGGAPRQNVPPAISFVDSRHERADGTLVQLIRQPKFVLTGIVIDDSPVEIEFFDDLGLVIEGQQRHRDLGDLSMTEFQVSRRLITGMNTLRLVARDAQGLTSSSEYLVEYERPLIRSPWIKALALTAAVVIIGWLIWARFRHQRRLRGRRFNPYTAGSPVLDEKLFFGREQLLDRILQTLHNNSLLLHGERRIGKTSLQHQLKKRLEELQDPAFEFHPVYIDLQGTPEDMFFATLAEEVFDELEPVLGGLEPANPLSSEYTYRDLVKDLRRVLKRLRERNERQVRLVLLIDEVDELNSYDPRINQKLRSLFMKSFAENLVAVVSGVAIKREWDREGSPWYNFFEEIDVGPISPGDARELVEQPVRGVVRIDDEAVDRILEVTGCRPYRIQKLCMNLVNRMYERGGRRITTADVDAIGSPAETVTP